MSTADSKLFPPASVDALIARQMPDWVKTTSSESLQQLHQALKREQKAAEKLRRVLASIPGLGAFAQPLLEEQLHKNFNIKVECRTALLCTVVSREFPSIFPLPPIVRTVRTSFIPLLSAALHNFALEELDARPRVRRKLERASGTPLAISFVQFAKLCRELDIGARYQVLLREHLLPADAKGDSPGQRRKHVEALIEESTRAAIEAAVRYAAVKGQIDESSYLQMLRVFTAKAIVPADTSVLKYRQLYVLGKTVQGVVAVEAWDEKRFTLLKLVVWIPGDPVQAVRQFASWAALYQALGLNLRNPDYRQFFSRFIAEKDRVAFLMTLDRLLSATKAGRALELDGRHVQIGGPLFMYLRARWIQKILDDAQALAVPTGVEDAASRRERLTGYENVGLTVLGLAGLFVPVLGEVMLGVTALQIAGEVYEGYEDWQIGDREAALGHLFSVAETLAVGAVVGGISVAGGKVLERIAFVDDLTPVIDGARVKLCSDDLSPYRTVHEGEHFVGQIHPDETGWHLHQQEGTYPVARSDDGTQLQLRHPSRDTRYRLPLERTAAGSWRHALEHPETWAEDLLLLRRLDDAYAVVTEQQATAVLDCTGFDESRLRQLHLENAPVPARLADAMERYRLHETSPDTTGDSFERMITASQEAEDTQGTLLRRDFPGLTVRGAKEICRQVSSDELMQLEATGKVPLGMAERVRWYLRDSRLDRACAGLRQWQAVNEDTEKLALGLVQALAAWPDSLRVELRAGSIEGALVGRAGAESAQKVISLVRDERTYSVHQPAGSQPGATDSGTLMQVLLLTLSDDQKLGLGDAALSESQLVDKLSTHVRTHRSLASRLIGQADIAGGVRPPVRFGDGRIGYPLSGHGESQGQAARRGIRQVFPTLDDTQVQQYLLEHIAEGEDPWSHYEALHRQWTALRQGLQSWRAEYASVTDYLRRTRVINTIRRSWRRKIGRRADGTYTLEIRGERVAGLPALPDELRFDHVTRLVLRDMNLPAVDIDFLKRFPNLECLDLRGNRLPSIPSGVYSLARLRVLRLDHNQIVLTIADNSRLGRLSRLERLELNHNPLGQMPLVRRLPNLLQLGLRSTQLATFPSDIQQLPWRGMVDLRNNQIRQVNQDLEGLRVRLEQMALHENPVDEASERLLQPQPGPSSTAAHEAQPSPSYRQHVLAQAQVSDWLVGSTGAQRVMRETSWGNLRGETGSDDFFRFLTDFSQSPDYLKYPAFYRARVWAIIEACEQNAELRELLFEQAGGIATCEDRLLWVFSQMEVRALIHGQTAGAGEMSSERSLLRLGRSLYRMQEVDRIAAQKLQRLRVLFADQPARLEKIDDVETYLAYRIRLASPLQLVGQPIRMHYEAESLVTAADINAARLEILQGETDERLVDSLAGQEFWQEYLRATYSPRFKQLVDAKQSELSLLEEKLGREEMTEADYLTACNVLKSDLTQEESELIRALTAEAYKHQPL
ncbi:MAG: NEL-type E3 ubiquitin ligase domain-containing protein [Pseudomonas sp.]